MTKPYLVKLTDDRGDVHTDELPTKQQAAAHAIKIIKRCQLGLHLGRVVTKEEMHMVFPNGYKIDIVPKQ